MENHFRGAKLALYDSESKVVNTSIIGEWVITFKDVIYGDYKLKETNAPKGYIVSQDRIEVFVNRNNITYDYEFKNSKPDEQLKFENTNMNEKSLK